MGSSNLRKKVERFEAFLAVAAPFEQRVRKLADRLHEDPQLWLAALKGHQQELPESLLTADGMLEWPGLQTAMVWRYGETTTLSTLPPSWNFHARQVPSPATTAVAEQGGPHE